MTITKTSNLSLWNPLKSLSDIHDGAIRYAKDLIHQPKYQRFANASIDNFFGPVCGIPRNELFGPFDCKGHEIYFYKGDISYIGELKDGLYHGLGMTISPVEVRNAEGESILKYILEFGTYDKGRLLPPPLFSSYLKETCFAFIDSVKQYSKLDGFEFPYGNIKSQSVAPARMVETKKTV